jgi:hypothetical protein
LIKTDTLIATDRAQIIAAQRGFAADLMPYILALAGVLIAAGRVQITVGLQSLALLRSRVTGLLAQPDNRMSADWPANWPVKVRMFAAELDSLLALRYRSGVGADARGRSGARTENPASSPDGPGHLSA